MSEAISISARLPSSAFVIRSKKARQSDFSSASVIVQFSESNSTLVGLLDAATSALEGEARRGYDKCSPGLRPGHPD
jgi:hypothetical protein